MELDLALIRPLYPFASHFLDLGGYRLHYLDEGQGPAVVMLHGNPTWSFYYREMVLGLRDRCRVIAPDHMGCGLSDKPQAYPYRLATHIENLERLLDRAGVERCTLGVHDWGGAIGFGYAMKHPERVERFVVFNTAAFPGRVPLRIRVCRTPLMGALAVRGLNAFARAAVYMACKNRTRMTPAVKVGYLLPYDSWAHRVAVHRFVQDIPTRASHPTYRLLGEIDAALGQFKDRAMLVCWGMRDFCFNQAFLDGWIQRFPQAEVHRFADAGHYVVEDAADEILVQLKRFLADDTAVHAPTRRGNSRRPGPDSIVC